VLTHRGAGKKMLCAAGMVSSKTLERSGCQVFCSFFLCRINTSRNGIVRAAGVWAAEFQ
jgi:hypothetical protein